MKVTENEYNNIKNELALSAKAEFYKIRAGDMHKMACFQAGIDTDGEIDDLDRWIQAHPMNKRNILKLVRFIQKEKEESA